MNTKIQVFISFANFYCQFIQNINKTAISFILILKLFFSTNVKSFMNTNDIKIIDHSDNYTYSDNNDSKIKNLLNVKNI